MWHLAFDASALAKRYAPEPGSDVVNYAFRHAPAGAMLTLMICAGEVASVLVRCRNRGQIGSDTFSDASNALLAEVIGSREFSTLPIPNDLIEAALPLVEPHSLNVTDACILRAVLDLRPGFRALGDDLLLISADARLLRAAEREGLPSLNPEAIDPAGLAAYLPPAEDQQSE